MTDEQLRLLRLLTNEGYTLSPFGWLWRKGYKHGHIDWTTWQPLIASRMLHLDSEGCYVPTEAARSLTHEPTNARRDDER